MAQFNLSFKIINPLTGQVKDIIAANILGNAIWAIRGLMPIDLYNDVLALAQSETGVVTIDDNAVQRIHDLAIELLEMWQAYPICQVLIGNDTAISSLVVYPG
jgi:hypothetical protein